MNYVGLIQAFFWCGAKVLGVFLILTLFVLTILYIREKIKLRNFKKSINNDLDDVEIYTGFYDETEKA